MSRRNPKTGSHPDLFFQGRTYMPGMDEGETPVFVPLAKLSRAQLVKMKRAQFTNAEWGELDEDVREDIYESDTDSMQRIADFAKPFVNDYDWQQDTTQRQYSDIEDGFESWLRDGGPHWPLMRSRQSDLYEELLALGRQAGKLTNEVQREIGEAMTDSNHYSSEEGDAVYSEEMRGHFWMDGNDLEALLEDVWPWPSGPRSIDSPANLGPEMRKRAGAICTFPDELDIALEKIKKDTDHTLDWDEADILKAITVGKHGASGLEVDWDTGEHMSMFIDWDSVGNAVREKLDEGMPDEADLPDAAPPAERVVFRWPDGFYVQDLLPSELPAEGKAMGMCVGRPDMGYGKAVRKGEIKIFSLRRPSGKPLFTIEVELANDDGKIYRVEQIKGKANRLPGFDLGAGMHVPIKRDEVARVYEFIESSDFQKLTGPPGIAVDDIRDAKPAAAQVNALFHAGDKWAVSLLARLGIEPEQTTWTPVKEIPNPSKSCGLHGSQCIGFCVPYQRRRANPGRDRFEEPGRLR